ncbi:unnamed protein product [Nyctereutes procyonoides]|uniref:(raccoon dog) hypothetical protein n=1 Tax=Nyctereutes procyonoides TaxID=34880 RepID=A0A811YZJ8_NYCPR|nr:unnamed protein product [Nyctereutes procyonoides]
MVDGLVQLQDVMNSLPSCFFTNIQTAINQDHLDGMSSKDIDVLIDSLPSEESAAALQAATASCLEDIVYQGDMLLENKQNVLADIA